MIKKSLILSASMLIAVSCSCQEEYPKQILLEGEKVTVLDSSSVAVVNYTFVSLDHCLSDLKLEREQISVLDAIVDNSKEALLNCNYQSQLLKEVNNENRAIIEEAKLTIENTNKKLKVAKTARNIYSAIFGGIGVYIGLKSKGWINSI